MAYKVKAGTPPNSDESSTTLTPTDDQIVWDAFERKDPSGLTPEQRVRYDALVREKAQQDYNNYKPDAVAPNPPTQNQPQTAQQYAQTSAWISAWNTAHGNPQVEADPLVLRRVGKRTNVLGDISGALLQPTSTAGLSTDLNRQGKVGSTLSSFIGEYSNLMRKDSFQEWMRKMTTVLGGGISEDRPGDLLQKGQNLWEFAGKMVAANPTLRRSMTPEEWLEQQYEMAGGDALYKKIKAESNPITHERTVQTQTVTTAQAQAFIDDMSNALLGRLANDAELKRARKAVQRLMTPTVTNTTRDATDPANVQVTSKTKTGVSASDAAEVLAMRMRRSSEGTAFRAGTMFNDALSKMA